MIRQWRIPATLVAIAAVLAVVALFVDNWPSAPATRWQAVEAIAASVTAMVALVGLGSLLYLYRQTTHAREQVRQAEQRLRAELAPYLRVDFSPVVPRGSWTPPADQDVHRKLTFADRNPGEAEDLGLLSAWPGNVDLCVWVWNMQNSPAGVADNVDIDLEVDVPGRGGEPDRQLLYRLSLAYVEPGRRVRYQLASVSNDLPWLGGRITEVRYWDMYGRDLSLAHGSTEFRLEGATLINRRQIFRGEVRDDEARSGGEAN